MAVEEEPTLETIEYRAVLVEPDTRRVLAVDALGGFCLPRVRIPRWTRPAEQIQRAIRVKWGLCVLVLDFFSAQNGCLCCAVAELLFPNTCSELK
jgi:hypothetical protein